MNPINALAEIRRRLLPSERDRTVAEWLRIDGDNTLRLAYDLNENSVVVDLGGYLGDWAMRIFSMYGCFVHVFEPVSSFAERIRQACLNNVKVTVYQCGLTGVTEERDIAVQADSSSLYKNGRHQERIHLVRAADFFREKGIVSVDLMKINIEGAEYDLLEHLVDSSFIENIANIQVQFHDFVPQADERMKALHALLSRTHSLTYHYPFVWENWKHR